jgi:hypothetical protein
MQNVTRKRTRTKARRGSLSGRATLTLRSHVGVEHSEHCPDAPGCSINSERRPMKDSTQCSGPQALRVLIESDMGAESEAAGEGEEAVVRVTVVIGGLGVGGGET